MRAAAMLATSGIAIIRSIALGESMAHVTFDIDDQPKGAASPARPNGHTGTQQGFECFPYVRQVSRTVAVAARNGRPFDKGRMRHATWVGIFSTRFPRSSASPNNGG